VELTGIEPVASSLRTRQSLKLNGAFTASYKLVWSELGPINPARVFASFAHSPYCTPCPNSFLSAPGIADCNVFFSPKFAATAVPLGDLNEEEVLCSFQ
jgi:hypothetical protein